MSEVELERRIQSEMDALREALLESPDGPGYAEFYAAQQALAWVVNPDAFASPATQIKRHQTT